MEQLPLGVRLHARARFKTFVAGANAAAVAQLATLAPGSGHTVVWLWGGRGCGKTHLLQATCAAGHEHGRRTGYLSFEDPALRPEMLTGWESLALVCADELQRVIGQPQWERALFALYDRLSERAGALLVAADRHPGALAFALPDLGSRLRAGLVYALQPLEDEGRLQALQQHAQARGFELPGETGRYLLRRARRDMHSLSALLDMLDEASLAAQRRLTIPFVRTLLGD